MSTDEHLVELGEAARRAGTIVSEQINSIVEGAERQAEKIQADAQYDAHQTRRQAVDSARRLLENLHALERPLGQLVMNLQSEVDRVAGELGSADYVDAHPTEIAATSSPPLPGLAREEPSAISADSPETDEQVDALDPVVADLEVEPEVEQGPPLEREPGPEVDADPDPEVMAEPDPEVMAEPDPELGAGAPPAPATRVHQSVWGSPPAPAAAPPGEAGSPPAAQGRLLGRLRRSRKRPFVATEGHCAVCQRTFMADSEENLDLSGWHVSDEVGLCPDCQGQGWQLPEGARLPFRRGGH